MGRSFEPHNHISGRDYTTAIKGALLSDARIRHYIRLGYYGSERRAALIAEEAAVKARRNVHKAPNALDLLKKLIPS